METERQTKHVYFDHNATSPVLPEVLEAMIPYFNTSYGNPSSVHRFGREAREAVDRAREQVAALLNADVDEIVFTGGGSESDNLAMKGFLDSPNGDSRHIVTSAVEHHAVVNSVDRLEELGHDVDYIGVDDRGELDITELEETIGENTTIASFMYANNETGVIFDIPRISSILKKNGIVFHTDAVQAAGKIPIDVKKDGIDLLSISGHKMGAPKGMGVLFVKKGIRLTPLIHGGHHEFGMRAGTENVPSIVGLGMAAELSRLRLSKEMERISRLRDKLESGVLDVVPDVSINGKGSPRLPNTTNISFHYVEGEGILLGLDLKGIAVSSGSACTAGELKVSHVLSAMHIDAVIAQGSIRFSLGPDSTEDDVDYVLSTLPPIIERLRAMSPLSSDRK